jgi:hypothetical protein
MSKIILAVCIMALTGMAVRAAQIGDEVSSNVNFDHRVSIPDGVPYAVTQIALEDGVWAIEGRVIFYQVPSTVGVIFFGANADTSVNVALDGYTGFDSKQSFLTWNVAATVSSSRTIDINGNGIVYLTGWQHQQVLPGYQNQVCQGFGSIKARKIRNNH